MQNHRRPRHAAYRHDAFVGKVGRTDLSKLMSEEVSKCTATTGGSLHAVQWFKTRGVA